MRYVELRGIHLRRCNRVHSRKFTHASWHVAARRSALLQTLPPRVSEWPDYGQIWPSSQAFRTATEWASRCRRAAWHALRAEMPQACSTLPPMELATLTLMQAPSDGVGCDVDSPNSTAAAAIASTTPTVAASRHAVRRSVSVSGSVGGVLPALTVGGSPVGGCLAQCCWCWREPGWPRTRAKGRSIGRWRRDCVPNPSGVSLSRCIRRTIARPAGGSSPSTRRRAGTLRSSAPQRSGPALCRRW